MAGQSTDDDGGVIAGINVTPLVDVTLVLLIIFMVTAKIIVNNGLPMDLPKAASGEAVQTVLLVELLTDGKALVDSRPVADDEQIASVALSAKQKQKDPRAVIRADRQVQHGRVIHVLDLLKRSGISKIAFSVAPPDKPTD